MAAGQDADAELLGLIPRLWGRIDRSGGEDACWPWTSKSKTKHGYGQVQHKRKKLYVHRLMCLWAHGPVPEGKPWVLHSCDFTSCCNPKHLRWDTPQANSKDAWERGQLWRAAPAFQAAKVTCPEGHPYDRVRADGARACHRCRLANQRRRRSAARAQRALHT